MAGDRLYLYLGRRDKKGMKVLTVLKGTQPTPARIADLALLALPKEMHRRLEKMIYEHRMYWEPWIEQADTYQELKIAMQKRGYKDLPINAMPEYRDTKYNASPEADTKKLTKEVVMIQKPKLTQ